jgi:hypothetical protein
MLRRLAALVGLVAFIVFGLLFGSEHASSEANATPKASAAALVGTSCDPQYVQTPANNNDNKVDGDFEAKYAAATAGAANLSDAQRQLLLTETANNAHRLAIWSSAFGLHANPNDWQPLVSGNCLSAAGRDLYNQFAGALNAKGTTFAEGDAPANGYNTQVASGTFQVFSAPGVSGNRKAIKVTMANGSVVWIMVRCGNVVYGTPPPGVPTTTPSTPPPTTNTCPPSTPYGTWPVCKSGPSADPASRSNAPVGGGTSSDSGPGTYVPPAQMSQPPATQPAAPAAPKVTTPPVGSSPDPVSAPPRQSAAPAPTNPATGCAPAPGTIC